MADFFNPALTSNDRVALYFEHIMGRPMTRDEKIPLGSVISGDDPDMPDTWAGMVEDSLDQSAHNHLKEQKDG